VNSALAAGECSSIRAALRKAGIDTRVKTSLKSMDIALHSVEGSESEHRLLRYKFTALRIWNGCSLLFFTLNPHDIHNPLLIHFIGDRDKDLAQISLDWDDDDMTAYYNRVKQGNALRLHELATRWPAAAARCVHWTFQHTLQVLFNAAPPANAKPRMQHVDTIPACCEPGLLSYVAGYLGIVEPQMRLTEHLHMLIQILGFSHPKTYFKSDTFKDLFRRIWTYFASICFTSQEAFAVHLGTDAAMLALQQAPLLPVRPAQYEKLGTARSTLCLATQQRARGLPDTDAQRPGTPARFMTWMPSFYGNESLSSRDWSINASIDSNTGCIKCMNHVCLEATCHKGRIGQTGFCRMYYFHYVRQVSTRTHNDVIKRVHGHALVPRWNGDNWPPVSRVQPQPGMPSLERSHPYHCKLLPGVLLGNRCNHDLSVLLRLPLLDENLQTALTALQ